MANEWYTTFVTEYPLNSVGKQIENKGGTPQAEWEDLVVVVVVVPNHTKELVIRGLKRDKPKGWFDVSFSEKAPFAKLKDTRYCIVNGYVLETVIVLRDEMVDASVPWFGNLWNTAELVEWNYKQRVSEWKRNEQWYIHGCWLHVSAYISLVR